MHELRWTLHATQEPTWPTSGRHLLAQASPSDLCVYQAYNAEIATYAVEHQRFGGPWSFDRMSWIKTSFLWMMHRSGWATKAGQERILAIHLKRSAFDDLLSRAVETSHHPDTTGWSRDEWRRRSKRCDVRFQWDPDYDPAGFRLERRALQIGLRRDALRDFATRWISHITDITAQVQQRRDTHDALTTPAEHLYRPADEATCRWIRLAAPPAVPPDLTGP
ncbi:MAG: DUF4291 domain-containing protein [Myxococcales bacterium]|nr:DUF4291 domain-containing protein [Myxococcales bacterium]